MTKEAEIGMMYLTRQDTTKMTSTPEAKRQKRFFPIVFREDVAQPTR